MFAQVSSQGSGVQGIALEKKSDRKSLSWLEAHCENVSRFCCGVLPNGLVQREGAVGRVLLCLEAPGKHGFCVE
jgi:hypothetical protein